MSALLEILGPWPAGVESWAAPCAAGVRSTSGDQGGEPDCLGTAVLEHRDVRRRDPDRLRELADTHLAPHEDRKSTRLNSSHVAISYAVFCLKKKRIVKCSFSSFINLSKIFKSMCCAESV